MDGADVRRRTRLVRESVEVVVSEATPIQRAGR
jgi:hypothetical protein